MNLPKTYGDSSTVIQ